MTSSADGTKPVAVAHGYIHTSADSGAIWTETGTPQWWMSVASSADGTKLVAAAHDGYLYESADSGATWAQTGTSQSWMSVASS